MSKEINTGNVTVDQLGEMNLTGNLVPKQWYSTIQTKTNNPKPYHDAINVLAEIVFRYRPFQDKETGIYQKKFEDDLLQISYDELAEVLLIEKHTVRRAMNRLEELGVLRKEFRTVISKVEKRKLNNVMFVDLDVDVLRQLTPEEEKAPAAAEPECVLSADDSVSNANVSLDASVHTPMEDLSEDSAQTCKDSINKFVKSPLTDLSGDSSQICGDKYIETYKESIDTHTEGSKYNNIYNSQSVYHEKTKGKTDRHISIHKQIAYDELIATPEYGAADIRLIDKCVNILASIQASAEKKSRGGNKSAGEVCAKLAKVGSSQIRHLVSKRDYIESDEVRSQEAYIRACLLNPEEDTKPMVKDYKASGCLQRSYEESGYDLVEAISMSRAIEDPDQRERFMLSRGYFFDECKGVWTRVSDEVKQQLEAFYECDWALVKCG
ncbi:MAG: MarR family transcriptional regulator [Oribacterium sp.]|nr:MarR family transcriptional regulator [Oribacterium sp.]